MTTEAPQDRVRLTAVVAGDVQGVGFRYSTMAFVQSMSLVGFAENRLSGEVLVIVEGRPEDCQKVLAWLQGTTKGVMRRPGTVTSVTAEWGAAEGKFRRFSIY